MGFTRWLRPQSPLYRLVLHALTIVAPSPLVKSRIRPCYRQLDISVRRDYGLDGQNCNFALNYPKIGLLSPNCAFLDENSNFATIVHS